MASVWTLQDMTASPCTQIRPKISQQPCLQSSTITVTIQTKDFCHIWQSIDSFPVTHFVVEVARKHWVKSWNDKWFTDCLKWQIQMVWNSLHLICPAEVVLFVCLYVYGFLSPSAYSGLLLTTDRTQAMRKDAMLLKGAEDGPLLPLHPLQYGPCISATLHPPAFFFLQPPRIQIPGFQTKSQIYYFLYAWKTIHLAFIRQILCNS